MSGRATAWRMTSAVGTSVEHGRGDAPLAVLLGGDDSGCGGTTFVDDVDLQLERAGADHDRPCEHRVHRAHRLLSEPFGHRHDHLREHLRALDHLPLVLAGRARLGDESVLPVRPHVEQVEQLVERSTASGLASALSLSSWKGTVTELPQKR